MKNCWTSPIIRSANSVEKMQVFWAWSSLRMSACTVPRTCRSVAAASRACSSSESSARTSSQLLPRRSSGCRHSASPSASRPSLRSHLRHCWRMAVLKKKARMVGAGPLMVIDTEVVGAQRSKPA